MKALLHLLLFASALVPLEAKAAFVRLLTDAPPPVAAQAPFKIRQTKRSKPRPFRMARKQAERPQAQRHDHIVALPGEVLAQPPTLHAISIVPLPRVPASLLRAPFRLGRAPPALPA